MNGLAICAGVGGLELALHVLTDDYRTVCYVEREAYAAAALVARMEEAAMDPAPIWDDIETFDGRPWRGIVDCVTAGYPCQPFSHAGKRGGKDDIRHLWPAVRRVIGEIAPGLVVLENVEGHLTLGFDIVRAELRALGYRVAAGLFSAAETGAPHERLRLFAVGLADADCDRREPRGLHSRERGSLEAQAIAGRSLETELADADSEPGSSEQQQEPGRRPGEQSQHIAELERISETELADAGCPGIERRGEPGELARAESASRGEGRESDPRGDAVGDRGPTVSDADDEGLERLNDASATVTAGSGLADSRPVYRSPGLFPPGPEDDDGWRQALELDPSLEPSLRGMADGMAYRVDRLRATGNGVHPIQAALAIISLWKELLDG